jgi:hypothetical protein
MVARVIFITYVLPFWAQTADGGARGVETIATVLVAPARQGRTELVALKFTEYRLGTAS